MDNVFELTGNLVPEIDEKNCIWGVHDGFTSNSAARPDLVNADKLTCHKRIIVKGKKKSRVFRLFSESLTKDLKVDSKTYKSSSGVLLTIYNI